MKKLIPLLELNIFDKHPVMKSFTGYVLLDFIGLSAKQARFREVELKFGNFFATHAMALTSGDNVQFEFFIICDDLNKPMAMASRIWKEESIDTDSLALVQYEYREYDQHGVRKLIMALPKQTPHSFY